MSATFVLCWPAAATASQLALLSRWLSNSTSGSATAIAYRMWLSTFKLQSSCKSAYPHGIPEPHMTTPLLSGSFGRAFAVASGERRRQ